MKLLVTVGSTHFEELIQVVDTQNFLEVVTQLGFTEVIIQYGSHAVYIPHKLKMLLQETNKDIKLVTFDRSSEFAEMLKTADLVISHAGSGTIFEALSFGRKVLVVVNERLMHNHQVEIADALQRRGYLYYTSPERVLSVLNEKDFSELKEPPPCDSSSFRFSEYLDDFMGFS
eukprot:CAMPEP_0174251662 /NCGR_PEP_ID=MMETSP0439-20130205/1410_1 /TAXON_ID=0 /ORGANISM="Stereomyxa ramosa, Strain Chinc5" /LENGTH=172 /DNA_ID=CAMNT_0015332029 /DNA_START=13 /DNA_END=531 /DNA_ORIENTATION=+